MLIETQNQLNQAVLAKIRALVPNKGGEVEIEKGVKIWREKGLYEKYVISPSYGSSYYVELGSEEDDEGPEWFIAAKILGVEVAEKPSLEDWLKEALESFPKIGYDIEVELDSTYTPRIVFGTARKGSSTESQEPSTVIFTSKPNNRQNPHCPIAETESYPEIKKTMEISEETRIARISLYQHLLSTKNPQGWEILRRDTNILLRRDDGPILLNLYDHRQGYAAYLDPEFSFAQVVELFKDQIIEVGDYVELVDGDVYCWDSGEKFFVAKIIDKRGQLFYEDAYGRPIKESCVKLLDKGTPKKEEVQEEACESEPTSTPAPLPPAQPVNSPNFLDVARP